MLSRIRPVASTTPPHGAGEYDQSDTRHDASLWWIISPSGFKPIIRNLRGYFDEDHMRHRRMVVAERAALGRSYIIPSWRGDFSPRARAYVLVVAAASRWYARE